MIPDKTKKILKKQHYEIVGKHSAVQICRWTKKSLKNGGVCFKEKFYGIKSHRCCQMTPSLWCPNRCLHCWRAIEFTTGNKIPGNIDLPKKIISDCIKAQRKLLQGFKINKKSKKKQLSKANQKKYLEAQEPMQFAISLSGEPTTYKYIGNLIAELRKRGKSTFLVTNGLYPEKIKELAKNKQMPTQLYVSVNMPNKKNYQKFHKSIKKDAWKKLNETLKLLPRLGKENRTVFRINLIKNLNMNNKHIKQFAKLIKKSSPMFVEIKGFMSVGFARQRIGYDKMPWHEDIIEFSQKLVKELKKLGLENDYNLLDEHYFSRVVVLGKSKKELKIKKKSI